jgi:hypothetical protein
MKINPTTLSWMAPTTNVDGTPIDYELQYEIGLYDEEADSIVPLMTVPSSLRTDEAGAYEAPIADVGLDTGSYEMALRSFAKEDPERVSLWSNTVEFAISDRIPNPPLEFRAF